MKVTQMPLVHAANLVANGGNTSCGVDVIMSQDKEIEMSHRIYKKKTTIDTQWLIQYKDAILPE